MSLSELGEIRVTIVVGPPGNVASAHYRLHDYLLRQLGFIHAREDAVMTQRLS